MEVNKNFGLTLDQFSLHLANLRAGDERLIEIIATSHFRQCQQFLIRKLNADPESAYDITADTLLKFRKNLLLNKIQYGNMAALFTIDARNNFIRSQQKHSKIKTFPIEEYTNLVADDHDEMNELDNEKVHQLTIALEKLGQDCYQIIHQFYYLGLSLRQIMQARIENNETQQITETSVKTKISECRKKLKSLLQ